MRFWNHSAALERCTRITSTRAWRTLIAIPFLSIACDDITWPLESTNTLSIEKAPTNNGDLQSDSVFATIQPLRVLVKADGAVASGVPVYWLISPDTVTEASTTLTDVNGIASLQLTLGEKPMVYSVKATLQKGAGGPTVTFSVTVTSGRVADLSITSGANQTDTATALLSTPYTVRATDAYGNLVVGAPIDWVVTAGGGTISPAQSVTTSAGEANARHTLGPRTGVNEVTASSLGIGVLVTFRATATPARPTKLAMMSGDHQSAQITLTLSADYVVRVTDSYDNGIPGIEIEWAISDGGGALSSTRTVTGPDGTTATRFTLGPAEGWQSVSASAKELPGAPRVVFTSSATVPPAPTPPPPPSPPAPPPPPPPPPPLPNAPGTIRVTVSSTGIDVDNSISVGVQPCTSFFAGCGIVQMQTVNSNSTASFQVTVGSYVIFLDQVALNCAVAPSMKTTSVTPGATVDVAFNVSCVGAGNIRVTTTVSGTDVPPHYFIDVDGMSTAFVGASGTATITHGEGSHTITLMDYPANCSVAAPNPVRATVTRGATTDVAFAVSCVNNPTLRVTVTTSGANLPASYTVGVDLTYYDYAYLYSFSLQVNGSNSIRVPVGYHQVVLDGVPPHCSVSGDRYRSVNAQLGGTVEVSYAVVCR